MQERKVGRKEIGLSAFLCGVVMLLFCVLSTGQFEQACALVAGDGYELYVPAAVSFFRNLLSGQGITYSWDLSFGMNAIGYYASYGGGSPFHLLFLLYPMVSAETIVLWILVGKAAAIGAAFTWFCKRVWKMEGILPAVFSMFYALCGFQVSVNVMNYLWMDAVYLLPLLLTLIVIFLEEGKWKCLVFGYAYLFLCHFYMGYMVGFFTAFFFLGYFFLYRQERQNSPMLVLFLKYAGIVLLAAGLLAFILVPSAIQILTMTPPDATGEEVLQKNPLRLLSQFLYGIEWNSDSKLPFVYSGMPVLMLLPVFMKLYLKCSQKNFRQNSCSNTESSLISAASSVANRCGISQTLALFKVQCELMATKKVCSLASVDQNLLLMQ